MKSVGEHLQGLDFTDQVLAVARVLEARSAEPYFAPKHLDLLFEELGLPGPPKVANQLAALERLGLVRRRGRGQWRLTPKGRTRSLTVASDVDVAVLSQEGSNEYAFLGSTNHALVPPSLAPPELLQPLSTFFEDYPFDTNVFGMTRFPDYDHDNATDPLSGAIEAAREVCSHHGLTLHLASDRKIVDDLWANVAAHLWGCPYGIAFVEARTDEGLNYNLHIEVGSCLALGRRLAILKDVHVSSLPTDLVGRIYHEVDLAEVSSVEREIHRWLKDDLRLGACSSCL